MSRADGAARHGEDGGRAAHGRKMRDCADIPRMDLILAPENSILVAGNICSIFEAFNLKRFWQRR